MSMLKSLWISLLEAMTFIFENRNDTEPVIAPITLPEPITPTITPTPMPTTTYDFSTPEKARHAIRTICDEEGLTVDQKNHLSQTVHCESGYKNIVHPNIVNGKVSTTDFGYFQINDFWHIGKGKDFTSTDYVMNNPEAVCRWMCQQWKAGNAKAWVCFSKGLYLQYTA